MVNFVSKQNNPKPKGLDFAVGRLVWVQRKNGSWWPGQIMDVNQSSLDVGKSSGVLIKLLGRDDVNVEWYDLEEAKQVKTFRCGDHDSCIEKAKARYNRKLKLSQRENAIILALELEAALMSKELRSWSDKVKKKRTPNRSGDDSRERIKKRMRGLDDVGGGSNMKQLTELVAESAPTSNVNSFGEVCMAYIRKKRSKVVFQEILKEDSIDVLTKVLESDDTLVPVPIIYDEDKAAVIESRRNVSDAHQDYPLSSSMPELLGYDSSDNLLDVQLISEEELFDGFSPRVNSSAIVEAQANEVQIESVAAQEKTESNPLMWKSKGKRNPRHQNRNFKLNYQKPTDLNADLSDLEEEIGRYEIPEPSRMHTNAESAVYDVDIEVEASYSPENVPNKSLISIMNRKPVSGHHIPVEVLKDGESDFMSELDEDYKPTETRKHSSKIQKACIPIKVLFRRINEALNGLISTGNRPNWVCSSGSG